MAERPTPSRNAPPVLSLTTVADVLTVLIDGKKCFLKHPDSLPIGTLRAFERIGPRVTVLAGRIDRKKLTRAEEKELSEHLKLFTDHVLEAPAEIHAALRFMHRLKLMEAFTQLRAAAPTTRGARTVHAANRRRSAKRSRG